MFTISTAIHIKNNENFGFCNRALFHTIFFNIISTRLVSLKKMASFSQILHQDLGQGKLMATILRCRNERTKRPRSDIVRNIFTVQ